MPPKASRPLAPRAIAVLGLLASTLAGPVGCGRDQGDRPAEGPPRVAVSIPPLRGLVEPLLGGGGEIRVLIPVGVSGHGYQPNPSDAQALRQSDLVVGVGLGIEGGLSRYLERGAGGRVVLMSKVTGLDHLDHHHHDHDGHDHHHHDHDDADGDPHLWLDPTLASTLVEAVGQELAGLREGRTGWDGAEGLETRVQDVQARIEALDAELRQTLAPVRGKGIVTNHAAFARFCERYGLRVAGVIRPFDAAEPTPSELEAVRSVIEGGGADGVFVEPQLDARVSRRMAEAAGLPLGTLDPLGDGDWFAMMRANADELVRVLGDPAAGGDG